MPAEASTSTAEQPQKRKGTSSGTDGKSKAGYSQKTGSYLPDIHRTLPHSADAEKGVLGSMLIAPRVLVGQCIETLGDDVTGAAKFHIPAHATTYSTIVDLWKTRQTENLDFIILTQALKDRGLLDQVGGPAFVTDLFTFVPTAA